MISGALLRDLTVLFPVYNPNAAQFFSGLGALFTLKDIGFQVCAYLCDNPPKNQAMYNTVASSAKVEGESFLVPHSCDENRSLYLLMDPVHIFNSIRNNWESSGDRHYPVRHTEAVPIQSVAKWSHLLHAYSLEKYSSLKSTCLFSRAVNSNNLEKHDVCTAVKVFNNETAAGIELPAENRTNDSTFSGHHEHY